ncbi:MAG TPA: hypothetical protein PKE30_06760 [Niabella sp.]|nr:hypothetical protein [Niabella sp.]
MKSLILSAAIIFALNMNAKAINTDPFEKALKTFNETFKDADNVSWTNAGRHYEASFEDNDVKTRVKLDAKGNLVQTVRYYKEDKLPATILFAVKKEYAGKEITGVTEVTNKQGVNYRIVLKDDSHYTHINAKDSGETETISKYKRGDK